MGVGFRGGHPASTTSRNTMTSNPVTTFASALLGCSPPILVTTPACGEGGEGVKRGARSADAISHATGTPPGDNARTITRDRPACPFRSRARSRPASRRSK